MDLTQYRDFQSRMRKRFRKLESKTSELQDTVDMLRMENEQLYKILKQVAGYSKQTVEGNVVPEGSRADYGTQLLFKFLKERDEYLERLKNDHSEL